MSTLSIVGIDVAINVALLHDGKLRRNQFADTPAGFDELSNWLVKYSVPPVHVCLQSTGGYSDSLARFLHQAGHVVSLVNPADIRAYAQSRLARAVEDNDKNFFLAESIARYCEEARPAVWSPPAPEIEELQALMRHLDALTGTRQQLRNRLTDGPPSRPVLASLRKIIKQIDEEIAQFEQQIRSYIGEKISPGRI